MNESESSLNATIPLELAGRRFDQALAEMFPDYSRSRLTEWIKSGDALLDGATRRATAIVRGGETSRCSVRIERETDALARGHRARHPSTRTTTCW